MQLTLPALRFAAVALLFTLFSASCKKDETVEPTPMPEFAAGELVVQFRDTTQIQTAFDWMDSNSVYIEEASGFWYEMPYAKADVPSLIDYFNQKTYIKTSSALKANNDNVYYMATPDKVWFTCHMYGMDSVNQQDFYAVMANKQMNDLLNPNKAFTVKVENGKEYYWISELSKVSCVKKVERAPYAPGK